MEGNLKALKVDLKSPVILKLGGSVITDKARPQKVNTHVIERLAKETAASNLRKLVIVHGGGSFGHPLAKRYSLHAGYKEPSQLSGFVETKLAMMKLNKIVVDALVSSGVRAVSLPPSAFLTTVDGRLNEPNLAILMGMLKLGLVPVLYGDVLLDHMKGFAILSGDQIAARVGVMLGAERIVLASDVDGVFTSDPKSHSDAKFIPNVKLSQLENIGERRESEVSFDVTGLMRGKLAEMILPLKVGIQVIIVNGLKKGRVLKALKGLKVTGTALSF